MIELCNENDVKYTASIVTNGYLLNQCTACKLKKYHVMAAQITVDGPKAIHDSRRPLIDGTGTYDTIINNIREVQNIIHISLRINVDSSNICVADQVVYDLKKSGVDNGVRPYLGFVTSDEPTYKEVCFSNEQFSKENIKFMIKHNIPFQQSYPLPKKNSCVADSSYSWVVDDEGYLYKCWEDIGNKISAVGKISDMYNPIQNTALVQQYNSFDPMTDDVCSECKYLPICLGGCPHRRLQGRIQCTYLKYCMQKYLYECARSFLMLRSDSNKSLVTNED